MTSCPAFQLRLLGRFTATARHEQFRPIQLPTRKAGALLAYLATSADYAASREQLASLLWGGCSEQQARQSLRQALAMLRKELGSPDALVADAKMVRLAPSFWSVDLRELETCLQSPTAECLSHAAQWFSGDFLPDLNLDEEPFEEWVRRQRTHLQVVAGQLCATLVAHPDLVTNPNQTLAAAEQLLALDPLREDWQRLAIRLYARYCGRNEALARANSYADLLQRELGVDPEQETRELLDWIRKDDPTSGTVIRSSPDPAGAAAGISPAPVTKIGERKADFLAPRTAWATFAGVALLIAAGITLRPNAWPDRSGRSLESTDPWRSPAATIQDTRLSTGLIPIIVLPFESMGGANEKSRLTAEMLTDDLTNALSRAPSFRVISRQTARSYRDQPIDVAKLGAELQVKYVLEGSVRLQEDNLRVNVELVDPASRLSVWSSHVERSGADHQGARDEIVSQLARELQSR